MFLSANRQLLKKSCFIQRSILSMNMNLSIHLVYFDNSYYPRTYADIPTNSSLFVKLLSILFLL